MDNIETNPDGQPNRSNKGHGGTFVDFIRIAIPLTLLLLLTFGTLHFFHHSVTRSILDVREQSLIKLGLEAVRADVQAATSDLMHLADSSYLSHLLRSGSPEAKNQLADEFKSVLNAKNNYDQIRFLDTTGMEVVRVNYNSGMPMVVPDDRLQNKGRRYYFTDTLKLDRHTVFVSPMDLNMENGKIETPLKPMLRFGMPVYDDQGRKRGVVLINYYADTIRNDINRFLANPVSKPMLLNAQGHWLLAPDQKDEWGFMFKNQRRFDRRYPEVWEKIAREDQGQIETEQGLFTFITIYPLKKGHFSSTGAADAHAHSEATVDDKRYFWVLVTHIPQSRINAEIYDHLKQAIVQFSLVCVIVMPLAWLFSRERVQKKWARSELRKKEQYLRTITSQLGEGLLVIDRQGDVMTMNNEAEHLLGWKSEELIGTNLKTVLPKFPRSMGNADQGCVVMKAIEQSVSQRMDNIHFRTQNGGSIPVSFSVAPYRYDDSVHGAIITFRDISERLQMQAELKIMATHDPLTGVKNRGEIERLVNMELSRAKRYRRSLAVLMLDIDHFKKINDTYGHQNGDSVLRSACNSIVKQLRGSDAVGRYGGEEFLVILPETGPSSAEAIAERLRQNLSEMVVAADQHRDIRFTVSIGVAAYPESGENVEKLIQIADGLLYKAKEAGRNRVEAEVNLVPPPLSIAVSKG